MSEINDIKELSESNFPIILKIIQKYQLSEPSMTAKYKNSVYHKGSFIGGSNTDLKLITCNDKTFITPILEIYGIH